MYLTAEHEHTVEAWVRSAALWAGDRATVSGVAAAWWHGLWSDPTSIVEVTIPKRRRVRALAGMRIRRRDLDWRDRLNTRHLWVTELALTVLEAAVELGERGPALLDRALQRRVQFSTLHRAHCRNFGRRGSKTAGALLVAAADRAASQAERLTIGLLRSAGLTGWVRGHWFGGYELDFAFPEQRIAIEVDGWAWHVDVEQFRRDRRKQNELVLAGWTVLRFSWHDLTQRPTAVVAEIRAALASLSAT